MPASRPFLSGTLASAIRLAVTAVLLAIGLRTWLVMGLIEPVTVAGSSMAPTLRGPHAVLRCSDCDARIPYGLEFVSGEQQLRCPLCDHINLVGEPAEVCPQDRLWIDRTRFGWRDPYRWEVVVARNPEDAEQLCVKRVVGLPGELVTLSRGNVIVNGAIAAKNLDQQHRLRQQLHNEIEIATRWLPQPSDSWHRDGGNWIHVRSDREELDWLEYQHANGLVTDDVTYNLGLTRQLNPVGEFFLSMRLRLRGEGSLAMRINDGLNHAEIQLNLPNGDLQLLHGPRTSESSQLKREVLQRLASGTILIELSNFDGQLLLVLGENVQLQCPWPTGEAPGTSSPFALGAKGVSVQIEALTVYRDLYYCQQAVGILHPKEGSWQLGEDEYFVLGDNSPISLDSRHWGPIPRRLLVGKPIAGR